LVKTKDWLSFLLLVTIYNKRTVVVDGAGNYSKRRRRRRRRWCWGWAAGNNKLTMPHLKSGDGVMKRGTTFLHLAQILLLP
jgi:hypothetical protein